MRITLALLISHVRMFIVGTQSTIELSKLVVICPEKLSVTIPKNIKKNEEGSTAERHVPKVLRYMTVPGENQ